jgi:hypothetical protein
MIPSRIVAAIGMVLAAAPAAADVLDGQRLQTKSSEKIGTAAAGDPKPYWARAAAVCSGASCNADFGTKGNKIRTIHWINCGLFTSNGVVRVGVVALNDFFDQQGYFSIVSSVMQGTDETAVIEYRNPVNVPAGARLLVTAATTGAGAGGQCTLGGTIE